MRSPFLHWLDSVINKAEIVGNCCNIVNIRHRKLYYLNFQSPLTTSCNVDSYKISFDTTLHSISSFFLIRQGDDFFSFLFPTKCIVLKQIILKECVLKEHIIYR